MAPKNLPVEDKVYDSIVIGAGITGVNTALQLAKYHESLLIESRDGIFPEESTSQAGCNKVHLGGHYIDDLKTAKACLERSACFVEEVGKDVLQKDTYGQYIILSTSEDPQERQKERVEAVSRFEQLKEHYKAPSNSSHRIPHVFGPPAEIFNYANPRDLDYIPEQIIRTKAVDTANTIDGNDKEIVYPILVVKTKEPQIDLNALVKKYNEQIENLDKLAFAPRHRVTNVNFDNNTLNYVVTCQTPEGVRRYTTKSIVNCTLQNIRKIDSSIGFYDPSKPALIRVKASLIVKLPEELKGISTFTMVSGAYCSLTNLGFDKEGNELAIVTADAITNIGHYNEGEEPSENIKKLYDLNLNVNGGEGKIISEAILAEAAKYVKHLEKSEIRNIKIGHIVHVNDNHQKYDLEDPKSLHHQRIDQGIVRKGLCFFDVNGTKMCFGMDTAQNVAYKVSQDLLNREKTLVTIEHTKEHLLPILEPEATSALTTNLLCHNLRRLMACTPNPKSLANSLARPMNRKANAHREIKEKGTTHILDTYRVKHPILTPRRPSGPGSPETMTPRTSPTGSPASSPTPASKKVSLNKLNKPSSNKH